MRGLRLKSIVMTVAASAAIMGGIGCGGAPASSNSNAIETRSPVRTFAPFVQLHPRERFMPASVKWFLDGAALHWSDGDCGDVTVAASSGSDETPTLSIARLGRDPTYTQKARTLPGCRVRKTFSASDYTRPYDYHRPEGIAPNQGFYLDVRDSKRNGKPAIDRGGRREIRAPVYYERSERKRAGETMVRLTYWMLFGRERIPGPPETAARAFEGDWRWMRVLLQRTGPHEYAPVAVRYGPRSYYVPWRRIAAWTAGPDSSHPGAFVTLGSHGLLPRPGNSKTLFRSGTRTFYPRAVATACPRCIAWHSWRQLRDAREQPWYGFGGGWGETLGIDMPAGMGPSRWTDVDRGPLAWPGRPL